MSKTYKKEARGTREKKSFDKRSRKKKKSHLSKLDFDSLEEN